MSRFVKAFRQYRVASHNRRVMNAAIDNASTPSHRDELLTIFQQANGYFD